MVLAMVRTAFTKNYKLSPYYTSSAEYFNCFRPETEEKERKSRLFHIPGKGAGRA
jgi:hypothetical protein